MPSSYFGRSCALLLAAGLIGNNVALAQDDPFDDNSDPFGVAAETDDDGFDPFAGSPREASLPAPPRHALSSPTAPRKPIPRRMSSDAEVVAALQTKIDLNVIETPLAEVAAKLVEMTNINVDLDIHALEEVGSGSETPVTLQLKGMRLKSVLNHLLREMDLVYTVRGGALVVTTPEALEGELLTKAYPVDDLVDDKPEGTGEFGIDALISSMQSTIEPSTWEDVGGIASIAELGKMLSIKQTFPAHQRIEQFLAALRKAHALTKKFAVGDRAPAAALVDEADATDNAAIRAALNQERQFQLVETPLSDVVGLLNDVTGINVLIDARALEDVGIGRDTAVTHDFRGATLANGLTQVLRELDLVWDIRDDAIVITTPEEVEAALHVRIYPVLDLVQIEPDAPVFDDEGDYETLIELITTFVRPTTWDEVGGPGSMPFVGHGCLAISQTTAGFAEIDAFLAAYRQALARTRNRDAADATEPANLDDAEHAKLRVALQRRVKELRLGEMALNDAATVLSQRLELPVLLDSLSLEDYGIDPKSRVTFTLRNEPLGIGLRRVLEPLHLTWTLDCGAILITTPDYENLQTRFYPVRDLLARPDDLDLTSIDARCDELQSGITAHIAENTWERNGGPAALELASGEVMIVSQTEANHEAIVDWLHGLRQIRKVLLPPRDDKPHVNAAGEPLFDKLYKLPHASPDEAVDLAEIVQALVAPSSWREFQVYAIRPSMKEGAIEVRHTAQTHQQIHRLFTELGAMGESGALGEQAVAKLAALALPPRDSSNSLDEPLVVRVMRFDPQREIDAGKVIDELRERVTSENWRSGAVFIRPFRDQLIIRQTPACQRQIERLLLEKDILLKPSSGGWGGFAGGGLGGGFSAFGGF